MHALIAPDIVLRDFRADDWRAVHAYARLPEVSVFVPWGPNSEEESRDYVQRSVALAAAVPRLAFNVAIELRKESRLVGGCNLQVESAAFRRAHIGYALHPDWWGRGLATQAAKLLVGLGFEELRLHRIEATCDNRNIASARVLRKLGMTLEGTRRRDVLVRGEWRDSLLFSMLEEEWFASGR